jgi:hypothetical protein
MGKKNLCPGCKQGFQNGRPYSMHIKSCKEIVSAVDTALKKHKTLAVKRFEERKAAIALAAHNRELAAQALASAASQVPLSDDQDMDVDSDQEV